MTTVVTGMLKPTSFLLDASTGITICYNRHRIFLLPVSHFATSHMASRFLLQSAFNFDTTGGMASCNGQHGELQWFDGETIFAGTSTRFCWNHRWWVVMRPWSGSLQQRSLDAAMTTTTCWNQQAILLAPVTCGATMMISFAGSSEHICWKRRAILLQAYNRQTGMLRRARMRCW